MVAIKLPGTDQIIFVPKHIGDIEINYNDYPEIDDAIKNEDIFVIGDWQDFTGSAVVNSALYQGIQDIDPSSLKGEMEDPQLNLTERGRAESVYRQRPRIVTITLDK